MGGGGRSAFFALSLPNTSAGSGRAVKGKVFLLCPLFSGLSCATATEGKRNVHWVRINPKLRSSVKAFLTDFLACKLRVSE